MGGLVLGDGVVFGGVVGAWVVGVGIEFGTVATGIPMVVEVTGVFVGSVVTDGPCEVIGT